MLMIDSIDPVSLPLWAIAIYAVAMYPLGLLFGSECATCCCQKCTGCDCCGDEWPRLAGQCCEGEWRTGDGQCCDGQWHEDGGECCGDDWYAEGEEGECCNNEWHTEAGTCCNARQIPLVVAECEGCPQWRRAIANVAWLPDSGLSVVLTDGGSGYATTQPARVAPTLTVAGGSGSGLEVVLTLEEIEDECLRPSWRIASLTFSGGTGYRFQPEIPGTWSPPRPTGGGGGDTNPPGYRPATPQQDTEALAVTCAAGDVTMIPAILTVTSNSNGVPVAVNIVNAGSYYATSEEEETFVFTPDVIVDPMFAPGGSGGAAFTATVDGDPDSATFGRVVSITIDDEGANFSNWLWQDKDYWYAEDGICCGGEWHTGEGVCCSGTWYPAGNECPEGQTFLNAGPDCCACFPDTVFDPVSEEMVPTAGNPGLVSFLACDGSCVASAKFDAVTGQERVIGRCCAPGGSCAYTTEEECEGTWEEKCCVDTPQCLVTCCSENADGDSTCQRVPKNDCDAPAHYDEDEASCEGGCKGACCVDGQSIGSVTQAECDAAGGSWSGAGETECIPPTECRPPFTPNCCESIISDASGLTFTQPRRKRSSQTNQPWVVTVTGTTDSEILIHGIAVGVSATPTKRCPINVSFVVCWDKFNIEPMPCNSSFRRLDVTVCWNPNGAPQELLTYSGCDDITLWLGDCSRECETILTYAGAAVTVGGTVEIRGSATIRANGGALVFPAFTFVAACNITLTLDGTSDAGNSVPAMANPAVGNTLSLKKTGNGRWTLTAASTFTGATEILDGTLIVATNAPLDGNGAFGYSINGGAGTGSSPIVTLGNAATHSGGSVAMLLDDGAQVGRLVTIPAVGAGGSQAVVIGGANTSGTTRFQSAMSFFVNRDVTLQAANGGTVEFANGWLGGAYGAASGVERAFTFGSEGNAGTVLLSGNLSTTGTVRVEYGTLRATSTISADGGITIDGDGAEMDFQGIVDLTSPVSLLAGTLAGNGTIDTVLIDNAPTIRVDSGDELVIGSELSGTGTLTKTGAGTLRIAASNTFSGTLDISAGEVVLEQINTNPGGLVSAATFSNTTLSVAFTGDPETDDEFVLLSGPTTQTYTPTLTGTTKTGTYDAATSTITID